SAKPVDIFAPTESKAGSRQLAEANPTATEAQWRRFDFSLTPTVDTARGRFAIRLKSPGSVVLGHVFLQPGEWGRFKGLPVRRDVAEGLVDQGLTVLRYGGCMVDWAEDTPKEMVARRG